MATHYAQRLLTAEEFLRIDFGDQKAELGRGVIRMMAGGTTRHSRVSANIIGSLFGKLLGGPCAAFDANMAIKTRVDSIRYPDVSVLCGRSEADHDREIVQDLPVVLFEVLSAGTSRTDIQEKLPEYQALGSVDTIVFADIFTERVRVVQRAGQDWDDVAHADPFDVPLPAVGIILPHAELFAR